MATALARRLDIKERPKLGKPLVERELFVIAGTHSCPGRGQEVRLMVDLQTEFMEILALSRKCTAYFEDSMSRESALKYNSLLERLVGGEELLKRIAAIERQYQEYGYVRKLESMARIRRAGVPIVHLPTEVPNSVLDRFGFLYRVPFIAETLGARRDSVIFENVCQHAHERNIIFIGSGHKLRDFAEKEHDFRIWRVDFLQDINKIVLCGSMPSEFRRWIGSYAKRNGIVDVVNFNN